ncbi:MAG: 30S ribosomal protein S1 [bacterium]
MEQQLEVGQEPANIANEEMIQKTADETKKEIPEAPTVKEPAAAVPVHTEIKAAEEKTEEQEMSQDGYEETFRRITQGQLLKGKVVQIDKDGVMVDIGYKSEGIIPLNELSHKSFSSPEEIVMPGDEIDVVVIKVEGMVGELLLSKKRADLESAWNKVIKAHQENLTLTATAVEEVKGGLIVDLGLRGFVPASHLDMRPVRDLKDFIGEPLQLKVIEIDRARRKVVLSRRKVLQEEWDSKRAVTMQKIYEGAILTGKVARLTDFGAFVNLGGVDGLVHISEISWRRIKHPSEVMKIGDEVEVLVLKLDKNRDKISLSLRQAMPDPWLTVEERLKPGMTLIGRVTKLARNYVFVAVGDGIEGLIPLAELSSLRTVKPEDILHVDQEIQVKILEIKPEERRMLLSLRQAQNDQESAEYRSFMSNQSNTTFTVGDMLKSKLNNLQAAAEASPAEEPPKPAEDAAI